MVVRVDEARVVRLVAVEVRPHELLDRAVLGDHPVEEVQAEGGEVDHGHAERLDLRALVGR